MEWLTRSAARTTPGGRKPEWLKRPLPEARHLSKMEGVLRARNLHTVCESALCPNLGTCFAHGTATFLIMGDVCTRGCSFCGVTSGAPGDLDPPEPANVADAAASLGLGHVVVTSVTRDDLPDGGAAHYVATIRAVRERLPQATVEVLVPDFGGRGESIDVVLAEVARGLQPQPGDGAASLSERPSAGGLRTVAGLVAARGRLGSRVP